MNNNQATNATICLQTLTPESARLCLEVEKFLLKQAQEAGVKLAGQKLILAYSGGADSKALFFIMLVLADRLDCTLALAHVDHALRPTSAAELTEAAQLAAAYDLPCHTLRVDVTALAEKEKLGLEAAGREARLRFFAGLAGSKHWILTGHQLNDLAEDMLMRLLRGSGWPALGGMAAVNPQTRTLRPLLLVTRKRLEDFLVSLGPIGQNWLQDPMNEDPHYLRNRIRSRMLPLFLAENPSFLERVADIWQLARLDSKMFTEQLAQVIPPAPSSTLSKAVLSTLPKAMRLRACKAALEALGPGQPLLANLLALDQAWLKGRSGAHFQFPGGKLAIIEHGDVKFFCRNR